MKNIKIIEAPKNKIVVTKENKLSKANFILKEKIKVFFQYIKNIKHYYLNEDLEKLNDNDLLSYIDFLNDKKDTLDAVAKKINAKASEKIGLATDDSTKMNILEQAQVKMDEVKDKIELVDKDYEKAQALMNARKEIDNIEVPSQDEDVQVNEGPVEIQPTEEVENQQTDEEKANKLNKWANGEPERINVESEQNEIQPIEEMPVIEPIIETEVQPIVEMKGEPIEVSSMEEQPIKEIPVEDLIKEEKKTSPLEQSYLLYQDEINKIEENYKESFARDLGELVARIKNETDKAISMQLNEISNTAKQAINISNQNVATANEEKAIVEQDRDQYKSHYEQTVEIVNQKDNIIKSKDDEIAQLKAELASKNEELSSSNAKEIALNATIDKKNKEIKSLNGKVSDLKISLATVAQQVLVEAKQENPIDLTQPIELGGVVEEESTKTM